MLRPGFAVLATSALVSAVAAAGPANATRARTPNNSAPVAFCTAVLKFDAAWPQVNLDYPGQPFFSDGNNDGIADLLQVGRAKLPSLGSGLEGLAAQASPTLRSGLHTLAVDVQTLAKEPAPATAAQSRQEMRPVEKVAAGVQRDVKAAACPARVDAAAATADQAGPAPAVSSAAQGLAWVGLLVLLLLYYPLLRGVWRHLRRPAVTADGSRFKGSRRRWKIDTITGEVLGVDRSADVLTTYGGPLGPGGSLPPGSTVVTETKVVHLLVDGHRKDESLVNFKAYPTEGDIVTVCVARKRSERVEFALLNHSTRSHGVQLQALWRLSEGGTARQTIMVFSVILSGLTTVFLAVFAGALLLLPVWLVLLAAYAVASRREASIDMRPLWRRAKAPTEKQAA
jgi:hypothetical protein